MGAVIGILVIAAIAVVIIKNKSKAKSLVDWAIGPRPPKNPLP